MYHLETNLIAATIGVVHGNGGGRREGPLVPHVLRADVPPEVEHDLVVRLELDGLS